MTIRSLGDFTPQIAPKVFVAPNAEVQGRVTLGKGSSVWYGCVLRGDIEPIFVGERSNIQDLSVIHTEHGNPAIIGKGVTIGHQVCLHGARVGDHCLIGMGALILSGAQIGSSSIIAAGSVVPEGKIIPPGVLAMGIPCKIIRSLTRQEKKAIRDHAKRYMEYAKKHIDAGS